MEGGIEIDAKPEIVESTNAITEPLVILLLMVALPMTKTVAPSIEPTVSSNSSTLPEVKLMPEVYKLYGCATLLKPLGVIPVHSLLVDR